MLTYISMESAPLFEPRKPPNPTIVWSLELTTLLADRDSSFRLVFLVLASSKRLNWLSYKQ